MSGGSFDYAYHDVTDLGKAYDALQKLKRMKAYCAKHHPEAVPHIKDMIQLIRRIERAYMKKGERIAGLLQAIEWNVSGDWSQRPIQEELDKLSNESEAPP